MNHADAQYVAVCGECLFARSLTRAQVETGQNPLCDLCGEPMNVVRDTSAASALLIHAARKADIEPSR